ncbi:MAG: diphthine synthase [Nanoarchaeota archaeon]|nr:diphthine synthase [Nanoarchaeota archaeon]MBU1644275.1 diphthine synthase [Nanoarchaeota archaeon]MBU1977269.1 diphthine synthase [Nanoarchaeota archaeon]
MLYIIGLGLGNEKDITIKGLETIRNCELIYLENYTSLLQCSVEDLEKLYHQKIILADRERTEQGDEAIIEEARTKNVAFLVIGDPFSATTHVDLLKLAKEKGVLTKIIPNASILTAIGLTGLQLYKFGRTTSIPFIEDNPHLETPYNVLEENQKSGLHTLFLLDLKPAEEKFMTVNGALEILEGIEEKKKKDLIHKKTLVIGCARLGSENPLIKAGPLGVVKEFDFGRPPHCLIIPGKLHFVEEEMLKIYEGGE